MLTDVSKRSTKHDSVRQEYAAPFGIAPMGAAALCAYRGDLVLARAAAASVIPMVLSASSLITLEDVARSSAGGLVSGLSGRATRSASSRLVDRVAAAGYDTFVVTADVPVPPNRENNIRNGFQVPIAITPQVVWDTASHPHWLFGTWARTLLKHGMPHFENMDATRGPPVFSNNLMRNIGMRDQLRLEACRADPPALEGQAVRQGYSVGGRAIARESGVDGVIVSNHGGRQLDCAVPRPCACCRRSLPRPAA